MTLRVVVSELSLIINHWLFKIVRLNLISHEVLIVVFFGHHVWFGCFHLSCIFIPFLLICFWKLGFIPSTLINSFSKFFIMDFICIKIIFYFLTPLCKFTLLCLILFNFFNYFLFIQSYQYLLNTFFWNLAIMTRLESYARC